MTASEFGVYTTWIARFLTYWRAFQNKVYPGLWLVHFPYIATCFRALNHPSLIVIKGFATINGICSEARTVHFAFKVHVQMAMRNDSERK